MYPAFENLDNNIDINKHNSQFVNMSELFDRKHSERKIHVELTSLQKPSTA